MTGSPYSNVLGTDGDSSHFVNVESAQVGDTTDEDGARPSESDGESSVPVEVDVAGNTHEATQDETEGQTDTSGTALS
jgi:hypothetical protein